MTSIQHNNLGGVNSNNNNTGAGVVCSAELQRRLGAGVSPGRAGAGWVACPGHRDPLLNGCVVAPHRPPARGREAAT